MARFSNSNQKVIVKNKIENYVNDYLEKNEVSKNFKELLNLRKIN